MRKELHAERKAKILSSIKGLYEKIGRNPSIKDWEDSKESPNSSTIINTFGSWKKAVYLATGVPYSQKSSKTWSREVMIEHLQQLDQSLGRAPTRSDFQKLTDRSEAPSWRTVHRMFGSWDKALLAANCRRHHGLKYTRSDLISQMHWLKCELGQVPRSKDLAQFEKLASASVFVDEFGSWNNALSAAGLNPYTREALIEEMKFMVDMLGRTPTCVEGEEFSKQGQTCSEAMFRSVFGTWNKAVEAAGYKPNERYGRLFHGKDSLIALIKQMHQDLGRNPSAADCQARYEKGVFPCPGVFVYHFGTWNKAVEAAGLTPNKSKRWLAGSC